ncbi:thiamine-phosphate kinase [Paracrocinitomix mangrovi]|uniref:thiamine-phosphate kinase n=1 Tax=Paracrocinitomix mangrovi TaxID=2862509 RepID=UPI001C8E2971|nr:thiamine-phosphate kinase [Paracrocinitomix mangrovi]UKN03526.1 thiamine-phosphate kinase [Paracrocinitomix mangrovi]
MENRTELEQLGEFGLIDKLTAETKKYHDSTVKGVGDDAAVIDVGDKYMLVSTDMLLEGIHFNLMYTPLMHLGYKAAIVNFSDIYAMNGDVTQITVSIAVSNRFSVEAIEEIYKGIHKACELYQVDLVGGDTTSSTGGLIISITAIGEVAKNEIVMRDGAKENDLIVVSGDLGGAFMGLQVLEREKEVYEANPKMQPELEGVDYILERQLKPEARKDVIHFLKELGVKPTSMIDVSDGLASELLHLCKASDLGCAIYDEKLPIDQETYNTARDFDLEASMCALNGGEDYELLFSISQNDYEKLKDNKHLTFIGHFTDKGSGTHIIDRGGQAVPITAQGWNHFTDNE